MAQKIHPINGTLEGAELIQAINDRLRRVAAATDAGGTTGARGAPGAPGPAGTVGAVNLLRYRTILGVPSLRTLDRELYDILAESTSVENYGVVGDGLADDHVAFQDALLTQAVNGGWLRIPGGFNLNIYGATIEMPSNVRLIGDGAALSKITGNGTAVNGMLHFSAVSDVTIVGIGFEGGVTTPVGIPYVTRGDPSDLQWTIGTTLRIESGCKRIFVEDCGWHNTGGYAAYWYGNIDTLIFLRPSVRDSRPAVMGVGSDLNYFGWNGGLFGASDGVSNFFQNVHVIDAFFANCTGHCFWTRAAALPPLPVINRNVSFTGSAEDCLGDITQPGDIDVYEEDFTARRVGMICTNGSRTGFTTPGVLVDSSPTAYRAPKWMNLYDPAVAGPVGVPNRNVPPTAADTTGILLNSYRRMVLDGVNGGAGSGDGMANATITCIATSAFWSTDPLIDIAHCGPAGNNINYCSGYVTSNSNRLAAVGENINFLGCVMNGFGFISIGIYGGRRGSISDCVAHVPVVDGQGSPFVLGCVGTPGVIGGFADRAYSNKVTGCHIEWPAPGGSAIAEDAQYGSFAPGDTNWIDSNNTYTCGALYFKNPTTSTTTNKLILTSVTAAAQSIVGSFLQSEGVLTSHADHALKAYRLDGVELWKSAAATFAVPSLSTEPSGWVAHRTYVVGNSVLDPSGHIQTVTTGGLSAPGPGLPPFSSTGGSVTDGTVVWKDMGLFTSSLVLDANYIGGPNSFFNSVTIAGVLVLNSSRQLVNLASVEAVGSFNTTTGGYEVAGTGVITHDRDFYGRSLSIGTTDVIAASAAGLAIADDRTAYLSQVYIGAHGATPRLVIDSGGGFVGAGVNVPGNIISTGGGFEVGATGVITNTRDFYGHSLSIGTTDVIAASAAGLAIANDRTAYLSQVYIGANGASPILVINSLGEFVGGIHPLFMNLGGPTYGGPHCLTALTTGAFDNVNDYSPIVSLINCPDAATLASHMAGTGWTNILEAGIVTGNITRAGNAEWESDGIFSLVVANTAPNFGGGSVAAKLFAIAAAPGATAWAIKAVSKDYDMGNPSLSNACTIPGIQMDVNIGHPGTVAAGLGFTITWDTAAARATPPKTCAVQIASISPAYFTVGFASTDNATPVAVFAGGHPIIFGRSQAIQFGSIVNYASSPPVAWAQIYATNANDLVIHANPASNSHLCKVTSTGIVDAYGLAILGTDVITSTKDATLHSLTVAGVVVVDASANLAGNFLKLTVAAAANAIEINGNPFADYSRNVSAGFIAAVGYATGGVTGGPTAGYVNTSNGYKVSNVEVINSSRVGTFTGLNITGAVTLSNLNVTGAATFLNMSISGNPAISTTGAVICGQVTTSNVLANSGAGLFLGANGSTIIFMPGTGSGAGKVGIGANPTTNMLEVFGVASATVAIDSPSHRVNGVEVISTSRVGTFAGLNITGAVTFSSLTVTGAASFLNVTISGNPAISTTGAIICGQVTTSNVLANSGAGMFIGANGGTIIFMPGTGSGAGRVGIGNYPNTNMLEVYGVVSATSGFDAFGAGIRCGGITINGGYIGQGTQTSRLEIFIAAGFTVSYSAGQPPGGIPVGPTYHYLIFRGGVLTEAL